MRLFHFSENPAIREFVPRGALTAQERRAGLEHLTGPIVWAIDEAHQKMYLFPRDCPRILLWAVPSTTDADAARWLGGDRKKTVVYLERPWFEKMADATTVRYEFPTESFVDLRDAGMWVSPEKILPLGSEIMRALPQRLAEQGAELVPVDSLVPYREVWSTTLHASGIRLRHARGWAG